MTEAETVLVGWDAGPPAFRTKVYLVRDSGLRSAGVPGAVHLAIKWGVGRRSETSIYARPPADADVGSIVRSTFRGLHPDVGDRLLACSMVDAAIAEVSSQRLLVSTGEQGGRTGFDLMVRGSGTTVGEATTTLGPVLGLLGLPRRLPPDADATLADQQVVRLAGGIDGDGAPFLTLYHRPEAR